MKLWHIECIVTDSRHYDLMVFLEKIKAYNVISKTFMKGQDKEPKGNKEKGLKQTDWLMNYVKGPMRPHEIMDDWVKTGFRRGSLYGALTRAVKMHALKKLASGAYKPTGVA